MIRPFIPEGGSAFPSEVSNGMSLRDYFAAKAIPMATKWEEERPTGPFSDQMAPTYKGIATRAYLLADEMLKAREA